MLTNDNEFPVQRAIPSAPAAHGQAALLLVESLIHGLCENSTLSVGAAVEIADRAVDVQHDQAEATEDAQAPLWKAHALLSAIANSLRADIGGPPPPRLMSER